MNILDAIKALWFKCLTCGGKAIPDLIQDNLFSLYCPGCDKHVAQVFLR